VDKALKSIEEEAEKIFEGELGLLLEDEPSHARNAMLVPLYMPLFLVFLLNYLQMRQNGGVCFSGMSKLSLLSQSCNT
jgi:hypothetical protein